MFLIAVLKSNSMFGCYTAVAIFHHLHFLPSFSLHSALNMSLNFSSALCSLQGPCGICRPMNPWRWWSSTTACRPWPTRSSSPTRGGSTSQTRTQSPAMPSGPPSSRTPPAASGGVRTKVVYARIRLMSHQALFLNLVLLRDVWHQMDCVDVWFPFTKRMFKWLVHRIKWEIKVAIFHYCPTFYNKTDQLIDRRSQPADLAIMKVIFSHSPTLNVP